MPYNLHNLSQPAAMRNIRYSWVSLGHFAVNLSGGQPKMYWWLCRTGANKSHEIAHICWQTRVQHMQWKIIFLRWLCNDLELIPSEIYDVTWNPRINIPAILYKYEYWYTDFIDILYVSETYHCTDTEFNTDIFGISVYRTSLGEPVIWLLDGSLEMQAHLLLKTLQCIYETKFSLVRKIF